MQPVKSETARKNITFGALIGEEQFVINIDEGNHVIIYVGSEVVGNGTWNPAAGVLENASGKLEDEEWPGIDAAILQAEAETVDERA